MSGVQARRHSLTHTQGKFHGKQVTTERKKSLMLQRGLLQLAVCVHHRFKPSQTSRKDTMDSSQVVAPVCHHDKLGGEKATMARSVMINLAESCPPGLETQGHSQTLSSNDESPHPHQNNDICQAAT